MHLHGSWGRVAAAVMMPMVLLAAPAPAGARQQTRPLTLQQSMALTLERNREIRDATLAVRFAERQVAEARGSALPEISANASFTRNVTALKSFLPAEFFGGTPGDFVAVQFAPDNLWNTSLTVSQPLFDYTVFIGLKVAGRARQLQVEALRGTAQRAATGTRKAFYEVLLARERTRLIESSVDRVGEVLSETRARHRAGLASEYDVLRLEVELGNLEPQLRQARDALEESERTLALTMGLPLGEVFQVVGSLSEIDLEARSATTAASRELVDLAGVPGAQRSGLDALLSDALIMRADVRQTEINLMLGEARIQRALSDYFPTLSAFYTYSLNAQDNGRPDFFGETSQQRASSQQAGIQLTIPIFSGFQRAARYSQERLTQDRSMTSFEELRQQAAAQIETLLARLEETQLRASAQSRSVTQAERGFQIASAQYREGVSSRLEVVDAENALRQSQFNYAQAVYEHLNAQADLDLAVGRVPLVDEILSTDEDDR